MKFSSNMLYKFPCQCIVSPKRFPFSIADRLKFLQFKSFSTHAVPEPQEQGQQLNVTKDAKKGLSEKDYVNPLRYADYFGVKSLFTIQDLFDARVHFGHKEGTLDDRMRPFIFGSRLGHLIFDLEETAVQLRLALNFAAHVAYRGGVILFASNYHQHCDILENTAKACNEYAHTRWFRRGLFTNSTFMFGTTIRLPDLCIMTNTLDNILSQHRIIAEAAKMSIPVIAVVDSNCNPNLITYPIPGNDDTPCAIELYCNLFKKAILKGKQERAKVLSKNHLDGKSTESSS